ncbi:MAG: long-chain fatty acid--CoA ligase [Bdellovibrionaceae bacterium]|nr:long-chain fatty acid--CoA ligase [Pseudobdellovibrionaceae bacterium]
MEYKNASVSVDGNSVAEAYRQRQEATPTATAHLVKIDGTYRPVSWETIHREVLGIAKALFSMGLQKGDRVAIMAHTEPRWNIVDMALLSCGFVTVPIYPSSTPEDGAFVLENSEAKLLFVGDPKLLAKANEIFAAAGTTLPLATLKDEAISSGALKATGYKEWAFQAVDDETKKQWRALSETVEAEDLASIVYTSGTTGQPKGAMLTQYNFASALRMVVDEIDLTADDTLMTFLPLSHILGRVDSLAPIFAGIIGAYAEDINSISRNIQEVRPTILISVPRIYEKIYDKIRTDVDAGSPIKQNIFAWAQTVGRQVVRMRSEKEPIPLALQLKFQVADRLVFSKIRAKLGGRIKLTASGGAPLAQDLCEFFHACGIKILEGYGLTETLGPIFVNRPDNYRFGTVGIPIGTAQVKIAEDGEILLKGPQVFKGYFRNPEATEAAFTTDGWFRTGDIGEIDTRGFLKITDRKKELIVTAGGKNIAPQKLENLLKLSPFISNAMAFGDKKKYITALVTLNEENVLGWAKSHELSNVSFEELVNHPKLRELLDGELAEANKKLASFESVKKIAILPNDWTPESGELTPSLKVKRKVVVSRYQDYLNRMY